MRECRYRKNYFLDDNFQSNKCCWESINVTYPWSTSCRVTLEVVCACNITLIPVLAVLGFFLYNKLAWGKKMVSELKQPLMVSAVHLSLINTSAGNCVLPQWYTSTLTNAGPHLYHPIYSRHSHVLCTLVRNSIRMIYAHKSLYVTDWQDKLRTI